MWEMGRLDQQTESAFQLLNNGFGEGGEVDTWVCIVDEFGQLCDTFGIGFGLELEAFRLEDGLEFLVVGDDTVVDDGELEIWVGSICLKHAYIRT